MSHANDEIIYIFVNKSKSLGGERWCQQDEQLCCTALLLYSVIPYVLVYDTYIFIVVF